MLFVWSLVKKQSGSGVRQKNQYMTDFSSIFQFRPGGTWEVLHQNHLSWRATLHQVNVTRFYNHFMNSDRLVLVGPFYRRICNVFSMIFFISEKWLISWNENFLFPIVVVNSQSNIVRGVPIGIPHSHISFTNSSSSLGHVTSFYTNLSKFLY